MSNAVIKTPKRIFRMGSVDLDDPNPDLPPEESLALYEKAYPHLAQATLGESFLSSDQERLIYPVEKPEVKTKG